MGLVFGFSLTSACRAPLTVGGPAAPGRVEPERTRSKGSAPDGAAPRKLPLLLVDHRPRSMLHVPIHEVTRAKFPVVDFHNHVNDRLDDKGELPYPVDKLLKVMDEANVRTVVVLTGPSNEALAKLHAKLVKPHPGRFVLFTQIDWKTIDDPNFGAKAAAQLRRDHQLGARGLKVLKELGLSARHKSGKLIAVDDPKIDPIWREAGRLGMPVAIHTGDPEAFYHPHDGNNERYEELAAHPDWSFAAPEFPRLPQILAARDKVIARHPGTTFVALHVGGWPENLDYVTQLLAKHPNAYVEFGARQAELGRQPRQTRKLFLAYPDRVLFGTDFGVEKENYASHFRWLETADEHFPYYNHPEQGRWHIYGLELPDDVLEKIYHRNADRVFAVAAKAAAKTP